MKKIKFLIIPLLFPVFIQAQQDSAYPAAKNFVDTYYKNNCSFNRGNVFFESDSIFYENVIKYLSSTIKNDSNYWKTREFLGLLKYLAHYPEIPEVYSIWSGKSDTIRNFHRTLNVRQKTVNYILDVYNYPGIRCRTQDTEWTELWWFAKEDFNEEAKQKISKLLDGVYTENDFNRHKALKKKELLKGYDIDIEYSEYWLKKINKLKTETNKTERQIKDSIYSLWLKRDLSKFKLNKCYSKELLILIGRNYMTEFIPQIKALMDTAKGFPIYLSKVVLARMGEQPYLSEILDSIEKFEYIPTFNYKGSNVYAEQVAFIAHNPRSINIFKKWMDTKYLYRSAPLGFSMSGKNNIISNQILNNPTDSIIKPFNGTFYHANVWAAYELANLVYGFPSKYKTYPNRKFYINVVDYTKKWFSENNGKIELNRLAYYELYQNLNFLSVNINSKSFKEQYLIELERAKKELDLKRKK